MAGLCAPLPTLRRRPRGCLRTAWGRCGLLLLHRSGLAPPTSCRSPGARLSESDPKRSNASVQAVSIAALRLRKARQKKFSEVEKGALRRAQLHLLQYRAAKQTIWIAEAFHHLEVVVAFHHGK